MVLRLVTPSDTTTPPRRGGPAAALSLTAEEARHFRAAMRNVARAYGSIACLAAVVGVPTKSLYSALSSRRRPGGMLVIRVAQAAGMSVDAMISGKLGDAGRCPHCGSRAGQHVTVTGGPR